MKSVLLDTHTLIWHLSKPSRLGKEAKRLLRLVDKGKVLGLVSAISVVELSLIREAGRRTIGPAEVDVFLRANSSFRLLPLNFDQTLDFALLGAVRDPFDRMIISAARCASAVLLSADRDVVESGLVEVAWD